MITLQDLENHKSKYPSFDLKRMKEWLTAKCQWNGKAFIGYKDVSSANKRRKKQERFENFVDGQ